QFRLDDDGLLALLSSPHLASPTALRIHWGRLTGASLTNLANAASLASLQTLELRVTVTPSPAQVEGFARSPHLAGLRSLWWAGVVLGNKTSQRLWPAFAWRQLAELRLETAKLDVAGLAGFGDVDFSALRKLNLSSNRLGDAGADIVARAVV